MNAIRSIRIRLALTQAALAVVLGKTQGNVHHYERGQTMPPDVAGRLIAFARSRGVVITYDDIYGPLDAGAQHGQGDLEFAQEAA